jgi:hypothetical protein
MAQNTPAQKPDPNAKERKPDVHWLYGAYVPKDVPLLPLNGKQRVRLFVAQSFTTSGIYIKSGFLAVVDQGTNTPSEWDGVTGFGQRVGSHHAQSLIQNSFSTVGNYALRYEPRYDRCRCNGKWRRIRHAVMRNFLTYNRTERELRPQLALYGAAFGSGAIASTWYPDDRSAWSHGGRGMLTQAWVGAISNLVGEFAPEIKNLFRRKKNNEE